MQKTLIETAEIVFTPAAERALSNWDSLSNAREKIRQDLMVSLMSDYVENFMFHVVELDSKEDSVVCMPKRQPEGPAQILVDVTSWEQRETLTEGPLAGQTVAFPMSLDDIEDEDEDDDIDDYDYEGDEDDDDYEGDEDDD